MPPKKAAGAAAKPASTKTKASAKSSTQPAKASRASSRKPSTVAPPATSTAAKPRATKRKASAEEEAEQPKTKKSKITTTQPKFTVTETAVPNATKSKASAAKSKATPTQRNGTKPKASTTATKPAVTKRKASDDDSDDGSEEPKSKKSKTAVVASKPVAKATTSKTAPKMGAASKKAAVRKPAPKTTIKKATTTKKAGPEVDDKPAAIEPKPKTKPASKKAAAPKKPAKPVKSAKALPTINHPPTQRMDVFVFGEGTAGELGLGAKSADGKKVVDVARPRLNARLSAKDVGVVQIAVGGMHCAALTYDNKILTWGVNDQGALGRDTAEGPMKEIAEDDGSDSDSDDDDSGLNPTEAEPREVDPKHFPEGTKFASLYAGDSTTFALTTTGKVYGWGTFRGNEGIVGFRPDIKGEQRTPMLIPELENITDMACGTNHVLALDTKGRLFVWGTGEQNQLGRRVIQRTSRLALIPSEIGLKRTKVVTIGSGDYHSFAIDSKGNVLSWGLNSFGQTGIPKEGENVDIVGQPTLVKNLNNMKVKQITGGSHHTIARTENGEVLLWGRTENSQAGMDISNLAEDVVYMEQGRARYLKKPTLIPGIQADSVATANDTCLIITPKGKAYSWGFSENYQTGQGTTLDVKVATLIDNTAVRDKKLIFGGVGGQFGILGSEAEMLTNGI